MNYYVTALFLSMQVSFLMACQDHVVIEIPELQEHAFSLSILGAEEMHLVSLEGESQRWAEINTSIQAQLGFQDQFSVTIDESVYRPVVDLKARKIFVSSVLNNEIDTHGITPLAKYTIFEAFGREEVKDNPFKFITTRPRLTSSCYKATAWTFFTPFAVTTLVGVGYLINGLSSSDPEEYKHKTTAGLSCLGLGILGTLLMGDRVLQAHGVSAHVTKQGKIDEDAAYFAIEKLQKDDLEEVLNDLNGKNCSIVKDLTIKSLIQERLRRLEIEAQV